jgi:hypothetical protein
MAINWQGYTMISKSSLLEVKKWLALICVVQLILIIISNSLDLSSYLLELLSTVMSIASLVFFVLFPFFLVKKEIILNHNKKTLSGLLIGLIVSAIFAAVMLILGLLGSIMSIIRHNEYISNVRMVVNGSIIGGGIMIFVGTVSGWISQMVYRAHAQDK